MGHHGQSNPLLLSRAPRMRSLLVDACRQIRKLTCSRRLGTPTRHSLPTYTRHNQAHGGEARSSMIEPRHNGSCSSTTTHIFASCCRAVRDDGFELPRRATGKRPTPLDAAGRI